MAVKTSYWKPVFFTFFFTLVANAKAQTAQELVQKGLYQDSLTHYFQAISLFSSALEKSPDQAIIWYNRGISYMHARKYSLALVDFNKAILLDTAIIDAYYNRHFANKYTNNYQFALADITHYIERVKEDLDARDARADLAVEIKEWDIAIADLKYLIGKAPENTSLKIRIAEVYILKKEYKNAEDIYNKMLLTNPDEYSVYLNRAYVKYYMEDYAGSADDINLYSLRQPGNPEALKLKADNYFYLKNFDDAANIYRNLLQGDSLNSGIMADYGHCLLQLKQYANAEEILTKSIRTKGESPAYAYLGRGIARYNLNKKDDACADWNKSYALGEKRAKEYLINECKQEIPELKR